MASMQGKCPIVQRPIIPWDYLKVWSEWLISSAHQIIGFLKNSSKIYDYNWEFWYNSVHKRQ